MAHSINLLFLAVFAFLFGNVASEIYFKKGAPHVQLPSKDVISGAVKFSRDGRPFTSFMGIQYARVPQRFAESELITAKQWEGVKSMVEPGPMCPQKSLTPGVVEYIGDEECLYLSVFVPIKNTTKNGYATLVNIHGGGYVFGAGDLHGPKYFMDE